MAGLAQFYWNIKLHVYKYLFWKKKLNIPDLDPQK